MLLSQIIAGFLHLEEFQGALQIWTAIVSLIRSCAENDLWGGLLWLLRVGNVCCLNLREDALYYSVEIAGEVMTE